ncbi:vesicle-associated membrane protein-associated protein A-like [Panonychus citri]|uniref:vesicle-associated membrane protein-associated protein A-like n=1 Tax=Panonychus citri TaxID=50023 RepID=UPI0023077A8B|nr:vesicle-associated membrane protein-associated protein A-like [Panonychus citri]
MAESGNKSHKTEQVLIIDPKNVIHFEGPYTSVVTSYLTLTNPSDRRVCFKVKTTAPRRYCVRPNNGMVEPKSTTKIAVMLQPFDFENQPDRSKHKFMIQTMFEPEPDMDPENMWKMYPDQIMDSKLKCVFDNTSESAPAIEGGGGSGSGKDGGNVYSNAENAPELFSSQVSESVKHTTTTTTTNTNTDTNDESTVKPTEDSRSKEELYRLMEENNSLRQELMQLKEDGLRKRFTDPSPASGDLPGFKGPSSIDVGSIDQMNLLAQPPVIGIILVALFLGLFLGKILF